VVRVTENKDGSREYKYIISKAGDRQHTTEAISPNAIAKIFCGAIIPGCQAGRRHEPISGYRLASTSFFK